MTDNENSIQPAGRIANHWYPRAGWRPGRLFDTWHVLFNDAPEVRELAGRSRDVIRDLPNLNMVPDEWLHMTIQGVGWSDELTDTQLDAVIQCAKENLRDFDRRTVRFGPPLVKGEALVLPAAPIAYLDELRNRLRAAIEQALGSPPWVAVEQRHGFLPHVSIAYARCDADAAPYARALGAASPGVVEAPLRHVALIRQVRHFEPDWRYTWQEHMRVEL
jgi:2'-5' RNA ligase